MEAYKLKSVEHIYNINLMLPKENWNHIDQIVLNTKKPLRWFICDIFKRYLKHYFKLKPMLDSQEVKLYFRAENKRRVIYSDSLRYISLMLDPETENILKCLSLTLKRSETLIISRFLRLILLNKDLIDKIVKEGN